MGIFNLLAVESGGFGLELDIFEANLINLAITIGILVYFVGGFLKKLLADRNAAIATAIEEAEQRQRDAAQKLAEEEQKLAQAKVEAQRILDNAKDSAKNAKEQIVAQAKAEIERIKSTAAQDQNTSKDRAIADIRKRISVLALQQVESELTAQLSNNTEAQQKLIDRSIALLGGNS